MSNLHRPILHTDGATIKLKNSRISFQEKDNGDVILHFIIVDNDKRSVTKPRAKHRVIKKKVVQTSLKISSQAMKALILLYIQYIKQPKNKFPKDE